jgi:DNA (cytosine-5)-methyltransferase 1
VSRPRLLDLFSGAGGAARGFHDAGFDGVGVDIVPQPDYPYEFWQSDAIAAGERLLWYRDSWYRAIGYDLGDFDAIHASPPCQRYTAMSTMWNHRGDAHPDLVAPTRTLLEATGLPWVIENVPGAPMAHSIMLCGTMFGLGSGEYELRRHRVFETSFAMLGPQCQHTRPVIGIYGDHARDRRRQPGEHHDRGRQFPAGEGLRRAQEAMGMPWATRWHGVSEAIPPAYTEYIGRALIDQLRAVA